MELLGEAKRCLPKDVVRGRMVLEEVVEYFDVLLLELRNIADLALPVVLPRSSADARQARLLQRMRSWDDNEERYKFVGMNPIYRDLIVFVLWGRHFYDLKEVVYHDRRPSVELQSLWS